MPLKKDILELGRLFDTEFYGKHWLDLESLESFSMIIEVHVSHGVNDFMVFPRRAFVGNKEAVNTAVKWEGS